jgi:hypothetical protein
MRKIGLSGLLLLSVCGCSGMSNTEGGLLGGGLLGAGVGALATRGNPAGALIGGVAGAMIGGVAGSAQDARQDRRAYAQAQANAVAVATRNQMTINDVVQLSQSRTSDELIIGQMNSTNSVFSLTTDDLRYLQDQGVSQRVIAEMQARRNLVVVPAPRTVVVADPYYPGPAVGVGIGYGYGYRRW